MTVTACRTRRFSAIVVVAVLVTLPGSTTRLHAQGLEANKRLVRRYFEGAINARQPELVDSIFGQAYRVHFLDTGGSSSGGAAEVRRFLPTFFETFPDVRYTVEDVIAEGDRVMIRLAANGTQRREFLGIPPAGRKLDNLTEIFIFRIADGKIVEGWRLLDVAGLQKRLRGDGIPPAKP